MTRPSEKLGPYTLRTRRGQVLAMGGAIVLAAVAATVLHRPLFSGNLGVVDPGLVFRCAQPKGNLDEVLDACRPVSILNLRGGSRGDPWYVAEVAATRDRGIDFYDLPISATRRPTRRELLILLDLLDRCRYPLLIHCKSGADRTGLVSGLYRMSRLGEPPERAIGAFSIDYGHMPIFGPERLHEPFREYADWLSKQGLTHSPARLRAWVVRDYRADDPPHEFVGTIRPGPRNQRAADPEGVAVD